VVSKWSYLTKLYIENTVEDEYESLVAIRVGSHYVTFNCKCILSHTLKFSIFHKVDQYFPPKLSQFPLHDRDHKLDLGRTNV